MNRRLKVEALLAQGLEPAEIASMLGISVDAASPRVTANDVAQALSVIRANMSASDPKVSQKAAEWMVNEYKGRHDKQALAGTINFNMLGQHAAQALKRATGEIDAYAYTDSKSD